MNSAPPPATNVNDAALSVIGGANSQWHNTMTPTSDPIDNNHVRYPRSKFRMSLSYPITSFFAASM